MEPFRVTTADLEASSHFAVKLNLNLLGEQVIKTKISHTKIGLKTKSVRVIVLCSHYAFGY